MRVAEAQRAVVGSEGEGKGESGNAKAAEQEEDDEEDDEEVYSSNKLLVRH